MSRGIRGLETSVDLSALKVLCFQQRGQKWVKFVQVADLPGLEKGSKCRACGGEKVNVVKRGDGVIRICGECGVKQA